MFQPSTLHTDFARQLQYDRRSAVTVARRIPGERRARIGVLLAALVRPFRRPVPMAAPAEAKAPAAV
ncbi:MAG TPA: hypothetical protein VGC94_06635 [Amnibacterium sp.]|jgi:hypothetical protein